MATILAVDDSSTMRQMLFCTLQNAGHQVTQAEDGMVALDIAREQTFDLVITDVRMPNMDGITLVSELRKLPGFEVTPLLVLSTEVRNRRARRQVQPAG
jgi:two-component system chemotaxis response regulator CheY